MVSTLTLRWIDDTTEQEVKPYHTTPRMQALAEAQIVVLKEIFQVYLPGFQGIREYIQENTCEFYYLNLNSRRILSTLPSLLLEAADLKTTDLNEALALEELNFALVCEQHQVKVTLDGILTILRAVFNKLNEEQTQESEGVKKDSEMEKSCF